MNLFAEALQWLLDPASWTGPTALGSRILEHLAFSGAVLLVAAAIGVPLGVLIGHTGRGRGAVIAVTGGARALPTLGLLTLFGLGLGIGLEAPFLALLVLALPPVLAGAYAGVESVDRATVGAARAVGLTERQILTGVELPLASPVIVGGLRSAALQVISTATLAAYVADTGLGRPLFLGLKTQQYDQMLGASILVALLALVVELCFQLAQSAAVRRAEPHRARLGDRERIEA
ncbi:ABC transporter permease [Agrococcus carbonis]|uniref:Osmoprotectant transport system permease protein n=1 Tax=Agrococcus carbonis TaxID=684552 RepID=A0A1H1LGJ9_9MICO|nr:ABC transporter permease subunit [Agrococcus carbonis]SDR73440.1 osmoprotectant transport system permease protein [Agrococcus carbonis]